MKDFIGIGRLYFKEEEGLKFLESVLRYLFSSTEIAVDDALKSIEMIDGRAKETLMTTAEKLIEQGLQRGLERGTLLKEKEILIKLISKKFGISDNDRSFIMAIEDEEPALPRTGATIMPCRRKQGEVSNKINAYITSKSAG